MDSSPGTTRPEVWPPEDPRAPGRPRARRTTRKRHALAVIAVVFIVAAVVLQWQSEPGRMLVIGPLRDATLVPWLCAGAVILLSTWVTALWYPATLRFASVEIVVNIIGPLFTLAVWCAAAFAGLLLSTWTPMASIEPPDSLPDDGYRVTVLSGHGDSSIRLYRGGPWIFHELQLGTPSTVSPAGLSPDDVRMEIIDGTTYLVFPTGNGQYPDETGRIEVPLD